MCMCMDDIGEVLQRAEGAPQAADCGRARLGSPRGASPLCVGHYVSVGWLGGIAVAAAPYRTLLLGLSALCLVGGAIMLWRQQRVAMTCGPNGACTPAALRVVVFVGLTVGAILLWLGYSYV